jgi:hypothetical protein
VFRLYTPRPGMHFRELREAAALLTLEPAAAAQLGAALDGEGASAALCAPGVSRLTAGQAAWILARRL